MKFIFWLNKVQAPANRGLYLFLFTDIISLDFNINCFDGTDVVVIKNRHLITLARKLIIVIFIKISKDICYL